jgi:hypothetical protein
VILGGHLVDKMWSLVGILCKGCGHRWTSPVHNVVMVGQLVVCSDGSTGWHLSIHDMVPGGHLMYMMWSWFSILCTRCDHGWASYVQDLVIGRNLMYRM